MKQAGGESASREPPEVAPQPELQVFQLTWLGRNQQAASEALASLAELSYTKRRKSAASWTQGSPLEARNSNSSARPAIQVYWRTCSGSKGCGRLRYAGPGSYALSFAGHLVATIGFREADSASAGASLELIESSVEGEKQASSGARSVELPLRRFQGRLRKRLKLCPALGQLHAAVSPHIQACLAAAICLADQSADFPDCCLIASPPSRQHNAGSRGSPSHRCGRPSEPATDGLAQASLGNLSSSSSISSLTSGNSNSCPGWCGCQCCSCCYSEAGSISSGSSTSSGTSSSTSVSCSLMSCESHSTTDSSTAASLTGTTGCQYEACQWRARLSGLPPVAGAHQEPVLEEKEVAQNAVRPRIWCVQGPSLELADNSSLEPTINGVDVGEQQPAPLSQLLSQKHENQAAPPGTSSTNLLNPMDMLWCGGAGGGLGLSDMRALSCTEASWTGGEKPGALAAQLAACARSKSLGGAEPASRQLKERLAGHANQVAGNPLRFLQRVGKLTIGALTYIRLSSNPAARQHQTPPSSSKRGPGPQLSSATGSALLGRRSLSQRTLAHRARSSGLSVARADHQLEAELVVPHQLAKFASASNLVGVGKQQASASGHQPSYDERLLYSREGVYMGPGALYSWRPHPAGYPSSCSRVSEGLAQPHQATHAQVGPFQPPSTTDPPAADIESHWPHLSSDIARPSARPDLAAMHNSHSFGSKSTVQATRDCNELPRQLQTPADPAPHQQSQQHKQARQAHRAMWLTNLTQRVHAPSQRDNNNRKSLLHDHNHHTKPNKPPKLSKKTRSNSLTGPLSQHVGSLLYQRNTEVSKSSLELVQRCDSIMAQPETGSELSQARRDLQRLLLEGGAGGNQNQQHQLLLESARCGPNESARTYGINLISSCVHCQLVAELACHHEPNAYLTQLQPDQLWWRAGAGNRDGSTGVPIYPSVVLTVCSKQTTLDEALGGEEEEEEKKKKGEEEELEQRSTSSSSIESFEVSDEVSDEEVDEEEEESSRCIASQPRWSSLNSLASSDSLDSNTSPRGSSESSGGGELSDPEEQRRAPRRHTRRRKAGAQERCRRKSRRRAASKTANRAAANNKQKLVLSQAVGSDGAGGRPTGEQQQSGASPSILLKVPAQGTKQARSASLDAPYLLKVPSGEASCEHPDSPHLLENIFDCSLPASKSSRSRSVDIALPASPGDSYQLVGPNTGAGPLGFQATLLAGQLDTGLEKRGSNVCESARPSPSTIHLLAGYQKKKFIQGEIKIACANGETRALKLFVDWHVECINGEHLWTYAGSSSDACYVGESECLKHGARLSCSACKIMAHTGCISILIDKIKFICKHTYKDLTVNNPRHLKEFQQENVIYHHWIHKRTLCGRCKQCSKTFGNTKLSFSSKEIQAITCSWCKVSYHNKENCYTLTSLTEPCTLGVHRESIIPPTWIVKLPPNNTYQQQQLAGSNPTANPTTLCNSPNEDPLMTTTTTKDTNEILLIMGHSENLVDSGGQNENLNPTSSTSRPISEPLISHHTHDIDDIKSNIQDNSTTCAISDNNCLRQNISDQKDTTGDSLMTQADDYNQVPTRHPQESTNQYQKHQLKQYYKQLDVGVEQMTNQTRFGDCNTELKTNDLHHKQHHHHSTTDYSENSSDFYRNFRIIPQPIHGAPNAGSKPVLVFVNPRSGGNQGAKMMHKFNWLLNPRQVFDLIHSGGPKAALNLYRDVPNLRILTIGGDGTASWILSYLDEVGVPNKIPVAVLPLGTGNDLARALGWGGGYTDEPIAKILAQVRDGEIVQLDRWNIQVERNPEATPSSPNEFSSSCYASSTLELNSPSITSSQSYFGLMSQNVNNNNMNTASTLSIIDQTNCDTSMLHGTNMNAFSIHHDEQGVDRLPMDVINNYFSFGVDAHIALEFHLAREAHPERFNSRLRNKMFYGQAGGKDLLKRKWKDLSNFVTLYCDGQDITNRLKELKVHSVLFLNIPSYGGGTRPWPTTTTSAFTKPRTDDGLIEVIGLTTYQLPLLQAGGHGTCIAQCKRAKIITSRTIPMQVDGEPCKLLPSILNISFKNQVCMLAKSKNSSKIDPDISEV